jgi:hypothetical protein
MFERKHYMKTNLTLVICIGALSSAFAQSNKVKVEDADVKFELPPMMTNRAMMVPLRGIVDAMGATMRSNLEKSTVSIWKGNRRIDIVLNSRTAVINNKTSNMEEAPFLHRGRIFVPLKFIAIAAGYVPSLESGSYVLRSTGK